MSRLLTSSRFPYLPIHVEIRQQGEQVEALLDTGFDGDLAVPLGFIDNAAPPDGYVPWTLADGSEVFAPTYDGTVRLGDFPPLAAAITVMSTEPIVGRGVTDQFRITLDHGKQVIVEP